VSAGSILTTTYAGNASYAQIDDPTNPPNLFESGTMNPDVGLGTNVNIYSFTLNSNAVGRQIRVGLMVDNLDISAWNAIALQLIQTTRNKASSTPVATTSALYNDRIPDWIFFDILNAAPGDGFVIRGTGGTNGGATLGGVTFDSVLPVTTLASAGLANPQGVAVDGAGNVYIADTGHGAVKEWTPSTQAVTTLVSSGLSSPGGVAVDGSQNVYAADSGHSVIQEMAYTFVNPSPITIGAAPGKAALPAVLPATANLLPPFGPVSSQPWLTLSNIASGVVNFTYEANTLSFGRAGQITLLGQPVPVTQVGPPALMSATALGNGQFQIGFNSATSNASFHVLYSTNLALALDKWTVLGTVSNVAPGLLQFTDTHATNSQRYYMIRTP
jgi:hypothetical protein